MYCQNCGAKNNDEAKFCKKCGGNIGVENDNVIERKLSEDMAKEQIVETRKSSEPSKTKKRGWLIPVIIVVVLVIVGSSIAIYENYSSNQERLYSTIQKQNEQADQLKNQISTVEKQAEDVQKQNTATTQDLTTKLNEQKDETTKLKEQAQLAQQALDLATKQSQNAPIAENSSFPSIDTRAIVLIICLDSTGNPAQSGSGTIINAEGYVLTNKHVILDDYDNQLNCYAFMNDGSSSPTLQTKTAYSLTTDDINAGFYQKYDAAILKINGAINAKRNATLPSSFPYLKPQGGNLKQGDNLYIFGYPAASSLVFNATKGIVSSFTSDNTFINTDAVIDSGNSGGAAITSDGRFVGIPTQKYIKDGDYLGEILQVNNLSFPN